MDIVGQTHDELAPWELAAAKIGKFVAACLAISIVGAVAIAPGWAAHHWAWNRLHWPTTSQRTRFLYWATAIPIYCASAYLMLVYVFPLFTSKYDSPYEDAPCPQNGGWGC